ncbi:MAG: acetylxylan esterase [Verrucomicrobiota bacterium]
MKRFLIFGFYAITSFNALAQESFPPLKDGAVPQNLDALWGSYDPRAEPIDAETTKEWEQDGIVCRVVRYKVGVFKGAPARVAAIYTFPKGAHKLPALLQIHGGGQSANLEVALTEAKRGYACLSLNWGGSKISLGKDGIYTGLNTDWGNLDATHPPQRNKTNHFAGGIEPDKFTLDSVLSPRNDNWFLVVVAARRALTFLEQQPEVDPGKLGVYGHSMGGRLTAELTGIDKRVKVAVPSCGGSGDVSESQTDLPGGRKTNRSPLEMACVSENRYIERIAVPTLWLSPTNDFHAHIDNMAFTWRNVPDALLRLSI